MGGHGHLRGWALGNGNLGTKKLTTMSDNLWYRGCVFFFEKFRGITKQILFYQGNFF